MNARKGPAATSRRAVVSLRRSAGSAGGLASRGPWQAAVQAAAPAAVLALLLYAPALGFAFMWDDLDLIVRNTSLHAFDWTRMAGSDYWQASGGHSGMWRPFVMLSFGVDGLLSHFDPAFFHAINVLAHAAAAALVAVLALRWSRSVVAAGLAGLWFALLPAHVEAVAWIAGRTDVFATLFTLATLVLLPRAPWLALVAAACAMTSKESAFVLPVLALLAVRAEDAAASGSVAVRRVLPIAVLAIALALAHHAFADPVGASAASQAGAVDLSAERSAGAVLVFLHAPYLWPFVTHRPLLHWVLPAAAIRWAAWAALLLMLVAIGRVAALPGSRRVAAAAAIALLPMLPIALAAALENTGRLAERNLMLPSAGVALLLALGLAALARQPARRALARAAATAAAALALAGGVVSLQLVPTWRDDAARVARIAAADPSDLDAALAHVDQLASAARFGEADAALAAAERRSQGAPAIAVARAGVRYAQGRFAEALQSADAALAAEPASPGGTLLRVRSLLRLQRPAEALAAARAAWSVGAQGAPAMAAFAEALMANGRDSAAVVILERAQQATPADGDLAYALGVAAARTHDLAKAREAFGRCVDAQPGNYAAWLLLAGACQRLGDIAGCEHALTIAAGLPQASDGRAAAMRAELLGGK